MGLSPNKEMLMATQRIYHLPMVGTVINWETFSGDPNDPVRPLGVREFMETLGEDSPLMAGDGMQAKPIYYDISNGTVEVEIVASPEFHDAFSAWLKDKNPANICQLYGKTQTIMPKTLAQSEKPAAELTRIFHLT